MARTWLVCEKCGRKYPEDIGKCSCAPEVTTTPDAGPQKTENSTPAGLHKCCRCGEVFEMGGKRTMNCTECGAGSDWSA